MPHIVLILTQTKVLMLDLEQLFNCHTHHFSGKGREIVQVEWGNSPSHNICSVGIHPQNADEIALSEITMDKFQAANILAIGEIGLDSRYDVDMNTQEAIFIAQLKIAATLNKPIILHCVNAWDRCKFLHKTNAPNVPLIYHGFNKPSLLNQVLSYPKAIISIGSSCLTNPKLEQNLALIPLNRLLVETDDTDCQIHDIYRCLSNKLSLPLHAFIKQINSNVLDIFKI